MPTGTFASDLTPDSRAGGSYSGGSLTGTGAPSQPRALTSTPTSVYTGQPYGGPTAGGSGYTASGSGQYASPIGPSAYAPGSINQYPDSIYSPYSPSNLAAGYANTLYGPQQQILADQLARQQSQLGLIGVNADYQTNALNRDNALAQQLLGLDKQGLGIDKGLTNTQLKNLNKLRGILGQQRLLAGDVRDVNTAEAHDTAGRKTFDLRSALTSRGAFNTVANERGTGRINRDLIYQLAGINQQYRGASLGLDEKGIGYDNQEASLNARLANIGLDYQRLGITGQQLSNALQDGLQQIGLNSQTSINQLLDAMGGTNMQQAQLAATILGEVANLSNLPPDVLKALQAALSAGSGGGGYSGTGSNQGPGYEQ